MKLQRRNFPEPRRRTQETLFTVEAENIPIEWKQDFGEEEKQFINQRITQLLHELSEADLSGLEEDRIISILRMQELFWNGQVLEQALGYEVIELEIKESALAFFQRWKDLLKGKSSEELEEKFEHFSKLIRLHKTLAWLLTTVPHAAVELGVTQEVWEKQFLNLTQKWNSRRVMDHLDKKQFGDDLSEIEDLLALVMLSPDKIETVQRELRSPHLDQPAGIPQRFMDTGMPELYIHGLGQLVIVFPELRKQIHLQQRHWEDIKQWNKQWTEHEKDADNPSHKMRYIRAFVGAAILTAGEVEIEGTSQIHLMPRKSVVLLPPELPARLQL